MGANMTLNNYVLIRNKKYLFLRQKKNNVFSGSAQETFTA